MPTDAERWVVAARDPRIGAALDAVYADIAAAVTERGPACWASGRCCNFEKTGHLLYVTGLEAAYTVVRHRIARPMASARGGRAPLRVIGAGAERGSHAPLLTLDSLDDSIARGGCPFQVENLCGVHMLRPLGCRVYFCDRGAEDWQNELSERALREVRLIHDRWGVPYRYAEWRSLLREALGAGA